MWGLYYKWAIDILLFNFPIQILLRKESHNNLYVDGDNSNRVFSF